MNKHGIYKKLNIKDPFPHVKKLDIRRTDSPNWGGKADIFDLIITKNKPKLIIELGSFLGDSTITMAKSIKRNNLDCTIISVDTWLGSHEHWLTDKCNMLHLFNMFETGTSELFYKFLKNIIDEGLEDYVVPMPTTTNTAVEVFKSIGLKADLIYMDADHDEFVVYNDLVKYKDILSEDGIIFGHDINWQSIRNALTRYCKETNKSWIEHVDSTTNRIKFWQLV